VPFYSRHNSLDPFYFLDHHNSWRSLVFLQLNGPEVREDEIKIDNQDQAENEIKTENLTMNRSADSAYEIPTEASECIDKYVIVNYDNTPYPGYVEDADS
jgi:hypothetical protein